MNQGSRHMEDGEPTDPSHQKNHEENRPDTHCASSVAESSRKSFLKFLRLRRRDKQVSAELSRLRFVATPTPLWKSSRHWLRPWKRYPARRSPREFPWRALLRPLCLSEPKAESRRL